MGQMRQLGFRAWCNHNPLMETCHLKECENVVFGEIFVLQLTDDNDETRTYEMCSLSCYKKWDAHIESIMQGEGNLIAIFDEGIPEEWEEE